MSTNPASRNYAEALDQTVRLERNELGQVVRKDAAGGVTTYAYDLTDQVTKAPSGSTLTVLRDRFGRVREETVDGRLMTYCYDELGRRTGRRTPYGAATTWSYDAAGRRTGMLASGWAIDFAYDKAGRELTRRILDRLSGSRRFDLDAVGRVTAVHAELDRDLYAADSTHTPWPSRYPLPY
ncbi:RHS repeat domain-containing protein [Streptomyces sp. NPDC002785]|uniref:RHS repeat domain-containing protein n=1 Tax=Streptomyces sp. NPDC002785 TaxID=3154543 RepID=UPI00332666AA